MKSNCKGDKNTFFPDFKIRNFIYIFSFCFFTFLYFFSKIRLIWCCFLRRSSSVCFFSKETGLFLHFRFSFWSDFEISYFSYNLVRSFWKLIMQKDPIQQESIEYQQRMWHSYKNYKFTRQQDLLNVEVTFFLLRNSCWSEFLYKFPM